MEASLLRVNVVRGEGNIGGSGTIGAIIVLLLVASTEDDSAGPPQTTDDDDGGKTNILLFPFCFTADDV
jgi:hypothetical protein